MNDRHPSLLFNVNRPSHFWDVAISKFDHEKSWSRPCMWLKVKVTLLAQQPIDLLFLPYQTALLFPKYSYLKICPWKSKVKVKVMAYYLFDRENSRSRSWPRSIPFITFEAKSSIDVFAFSFMANGPVHIWPWKFKIKIVVKTLFVTTRETSVCPSSMNQLTGATKSPFYQDALTLG